jgi:hypothetical protein
MPVKWTPEYKKIAKLSAGVNTYSDVLFERGLLRILSFFTCDGPRVDTKVDFFNFAKYEMNTLLKFISRNVAIFREIF